MRNISFFLTTPQFLDGSKDVTRRLGWNNLKAGDRLMAVEKGQGLKPGEGIKRLGAIEIVSVRKERLDAITAEDCPREGFPEMKPADFVSFFMTQGRDISESTLVNRIEFKRLPNNQGAK